MGVLYRMPSLKEHYDKGVLYQSPVKAPSVFEETDFKPTTLQRLGLIVSKNLHSVNCKCGCSNLNTITCISCVPLILEAHKRESSIKVL